MTYPNEMTPQRDRYFLLPLFILVPVGLMWGVVLPAKHRMEAAQARMDAANAQLEIIGHVAPLTDEERKVLEDPKAPWRSRMPVLSDDLGKLQHYTRVVTLLQDDFHANGAQVVGIRSSWDPIKADFTTPPSLAISSKEEAAAPSPDAMAAGWALEVQVAMPPSALSRGLAALPLVGPLMVPAGLRWEARDGKPFQALVLRNLYLTPPPPPPPAP